jgi:hypothetical protein
MKDILDDIFDCVLLYLLTLLDTLYLLDDESDCRATIRLEELSVTI